MSQVDWIVNRLHVATPRLEVLMNIMDRFNKKHRFSKEVATDRAQVLREALRSHKRNQDIVRRYRF